MYSSHVRINLDHILGILKTKAHRLHKHNSVSPPLVTPRRLVYVAPSAPRPDVSLHQGSTLFN